MVTILMENNGLCDILTTTLGGCGGSGAGTYMTSLAGLYGLATHYTAIAHPSEPNYLALTGGSTFGYTSDGNCCYMISSPNVVDRLESAGLTWQAFAEDSSGSGTCSFMPPRSGDHFPFIDFSDMNTASRCSHFLTTSSPTDSEFLAALNSASPPDYVWLTPNDSDNCHDTTVSFCDAYLATLVPLILSSTMFTNQRSALFIVFDEGNDSCSTGNSSGDCVYAAIAGPVAKNAFTSSNSYSHYSYLHTVEANWNLATLTSNDAGAGTMGEFFRTNPPPALSSSFTYDPTAPVVGTSINFSGSASGGTSPYTYSWDFGDGSTGTSSSVTHTYSSTGTFRVSLTVKDSSSPQQTAISQQSVTVSNLSPSPLTSSFTYSPSSPEPSRSVTFSGTASGGTTPYSFSWNFGDGATGTGIIVTHTYTMAQSFTITETAMDSSSPQQSATSSQTVTVVSSLTGNFGVCNSLPQGWNCGNLHPIAPSPSSAQIVTGVFQSRQSNPGLGGSNDYYYSTTQKGTFPWTPCSAPASGVMPSGITSVSVNFTSLYYNPGSSPSSDRYHIYIALYYWLPNGPVSAGGSTYQCLDTQVRVENIGGTFSPIGSTATYDPGDSFGWDKVTLQVSPGQTGILTANVANQCLQDLKAWGLPTNTPCQLAGIEIGTEGYQFQELDVNWYDVNLNVGPIPLSTRFTISPSNPIVNTLVTFTATTTGGTSPYTTSWNFGDGATGTGASIAHSYSSVQTFTVTETATDSSLSSQTVTSSHTVAVRPTPTLSTSFTFLPAAPLVKSPVAFAAVTTGGTSPYTISWGFGDGTTGTGSTATHAYSAAGTFTVILTVNDSGLPRQTASSQLSITVTSPPPTLTAIFTYSPSMPQVGQQITFSASTNGGTAPYTLGWSLGDGSVTSGSIVTHTYSSTGTFNAVLTAEDAGSPQQTATFQQTVTVTNPPPPTLVAGFSYSPISPEAGQQLEFTGSASGGVTPYVFSWSFGDGSIATGNSSLHTYTSSGWYIVALTVGDANGDAANYSKTVTVAGVPNISFSYSPASPEASSPVTFNASTTGGVGPFTFSWSFGDGSLSVINPASHTYFMPGSFTVTLTATDSDGVNASSSQVIIVAPALSVGLTNNPTTPEADQPVNFTATQSGGVGNVSLSWDFGDNSSSTENPAMHTYTSSGFFIVSATATDADGVNTTSTQTVNVVASLGASLTFSPSSPDAGDNIIFVASATGGVQPYNYSWSFGDSTIGSGSPVSHIYQSDGSYTVILTVADANNQTASAIVTLAVKHRDGSCHHNTDCTGHTAQTLDFSAIASSGNALYIFTWIFAYFYNPPALGREIVLARILAWKSLRHRR